MGKAASQLGHQYSSAFTQTLDRVWQIGQLIASVITPHHRQSLATETPVVLSWRDTSPVTVVVPPHSNTEHGWFGADVHIPVLVQLDYLWWQTAQWTVRHLSSFLFRRAVGYRSCSNGICHSSLGDTAEWLRTFGHGLALGWSVSRRAKQRCGSADGQSRSSQLCYSSDYGKPVQLSWYSDDGDKTNDEYPSSQKIPS